MIKLLNDIRNAENSISNNSKIINTIVMDNVPKNVDKMF